MHLRLRLVRDPLEHTMNLFLTRDELHELTGLQQAAAQRRWLETHGWRYEIAANGRPKVARLYFERKMAEIAVPPDQPREPWAVNVSALRRG